MERDLHSQNAMFEYLKSLEDINYDQRDDLGVYEQLASIFDAKLFEYNAIMQEVKRHQKLADKQLATGIELEGLEYEISKK
jgi:hypothetical protein